MNKKLVYEKNKGSFIKRCPCSPGRLGCNYFILSPGFGCPFNCSYCFLNFYSEEKHMTIYSNLDDMYEELINFADRSSIPLRIGTGEFMDSMALGELDEVNMELVKLLKKRDWVVLEFKTKSTNIDPFLNIPAQKNIVLSWSLNPQWIIDMEEPGTASLKERLDSAYMAVKHGYPVALHLDPIFMTEDTLKDYLDLIEQIFQTIPPESVAWFSMGGFRYVDELKLSIMENSEKWFLCHEYIRCGDGKYRYPRFIRLRFYNELGKRIKERGDIKVYLCMEDADLWEQIVWGNFKVLCKLHPADSLVYTNKL